jgi:hypothetical protein
VNAAEQAISLELASKIAAVVNRFKLAFPHARADLKPWMNDPETQELVDPDSIDIGFHFPGVSRSLQSRSILLQIRFHEDPIAGERRAIGAEMAGFDHRGKQWWLSTIKNWAFEGNSLPDTEMGHQLKAFLREALDLFH